MESLDDTDWDVVISGTGLPESLLALALSRSDKKILHVDPNNYYGGHEAALSLSEAESWAEKHGGDTASTFSHASFTRPPSDEAGNIRLLSSRAYSLALAPQLIYARSSLIDALVSSQTHTQLEFQAVGSWFIVNAPPEGSASQARLMRIPGGREDIFQDGTLNMKEKRALMKFLRFVSQYEEEPEIWQNCSSTNFPDFLQERFNLPSSAHASLIALAMEASPAASTSIETALSGIARHLRSIGYFGAGFGAVLPKWGGLAEIGQVACRACAVGGGVYVLGRGVLGVKTAEGEAATVELSNGDFVRTKWLVGSAEAFPGAKLSAPSTEGSELFSTHMISIIASPLTSLFPQTSEGGVMPAGAVVLVPASKEDEPPVYIFVHSSESGECPSNQSVIYASTRQGHENGSTRLEDAVNLLLESVGEMVVPQAIWSMKYQSHAGARSLEGSVDEEANLQIMKLPPLSSSLVVLDNALDSLQAAWQKITGAGPEAFMKFDVREGGLEDDDAE